jgi:membrane protein YdbS with pleckstrin-like domain
VERAMRQYYVTNNEVMEIEGFVRKKRTVIPYQSIADVKVVKGVAGRIFRFGDVIIAGMKESIKMKGMKNPDEIYKIMENKIALMKTGGRGRRIEREVEEEKED